MNCLSKKASIRRPLTFWDYFWSPLMLPFKCQRCLKYWRFPTILVGLELLIDRIDSAPRKSDGDSRKRKSRSKSKSKRQ
jgi:hypothetical protein